MGTKKIKIPHLPNDAIVKIDVSGDFYRKLQAVLIATGQSQDIEKFNTALEKLKNNQPPDNMFEGQVHILTIMIATIEEAAIAQKLTEDAEVEVDENYQPTTTGN